MRKRCAVELAGCAVEGELLKGTGTGDVEIILPKDRRGEDGVAQVDGLHDVVAGTAEFSNAVAIEKEQVALLAASDDQVSYGTSRLIDENGCRPGSEIGVIGVERRLIERSEVIRHGETASDAEPHNAITIVRSAGVRVESSVAGDEKEIPGTTFLKGFGFKPGRKYNEINAASIAEGRTKRLPHRLV